jgi:hypothetical protein
MVTGFFDAPDDINLAPPDNQGKTVWMSGVAAPHRKPHFFVWVTRSIAEDGTGVYEKLTTCCSSQLLSAHAVG